MPDPDSNRLSVLRASLVGLAAGGAALVLQTGIWWLGTLRVSLSSSMDPHFSLPLIGMIGGFISGLLVQVFAPTANGSGIPQVRAYLLGAQIPLDIKLAVVKLFAGIIALGSGLFLGREGPTVHVGAAVAAHLDKAFPGSDLRKKQMVAAGAGAGLAAAFNAPVAGVLFVLEEMLKETSSHTVGLAIIACFFASLMTKIGFSDPVSQANTLQHIQLSLSWQDIVFYVLTGLAAGACASLFNHGIIAFLDFYNKFPKIPTCLRVGFAGLISGLVIASLPPGHQFHDYAALKEVLIGGHAHWWVVPTAFLVFFFLTLLAYGSGAPGGLFAPALVIGSALGFMMGYVENALFACGSLETMAIVGMGAFFAAVARVPLTAIIIILEITGQFELVLPLMLASSIAIMAISHLDKGSVYDMLRQWGGMKTAESD